MPSCRIAVLKASSWRPPSSTVVPDMSSTASFSGRRERKSRWGWVVAGIITTVLP
ncbi:hypothetical protein ACFFX0_22985 [Citricoccus parietis]|uniref:Uncharacterized protein n=1 Tax=Citricoccus parietis TaxID=592307 RepID=A0ABV5G629_9MICC